MAIGRKVGGEEQARPLLHWSRVLGHVSCLPAAEHGVAPFEFALEGGNHEFNSRHQVLELRLLEA